MDLWMPSILREDLHIVTIAALTVNATILVTLTNTHTRNGRALSHGWYLGRANNCFIADRNSKLLR